MLKKGRDAYVSRLNDIYRRNVEKKSIELIRSQGRFAGPNEIVISGGETLKAAHILIATGGFPTVPEVPGAELGITSDGFFELDAQPNRVAVIGSGYIAVELAGVFRALGSEVAQFMRYDGVLRAVEETLGRHLMEHMLESGIEMISGACPRLSPRHS